MLHLQISVRRLVVLMTLGICAPVQAVNPSQEAVRSTIEAFSKALEAGQTSLLHELSADSFRMVEDGVDYDLESSVLSIKEALKSGTVVRTTGDFTVFTEGSVAWAVYHVGVSFRSARNSFSFHRIETAVLVDRGAGWKVAMITSMPIETSASH